MTKQSYLNTYNLFKLNKIHYLLTIIMFLGEHCENKINSNLYRINILRQYLIYHNLTYDLKLIGTVGYFCSTT